MGRLEERWTKISKKKEEIFIGRGNLVETFETLYESINERDTTVLNFYGIGGIGKTTLLNQIKKSATNKEIPVFYYDLAKYSYTQLLIEYELYTCRMLEETLDKYLNYRLQ